MGLTIILPGIVLYRVQAEDDAVTHAQTQQQQEVAACSAGENHGVTNATEHNKHNRVEKTACERQDVLVEHGRDKEHCECR